ncbi:hypothetical protein ACN3E9_03490 [Vibrio pectenicida]|uniref:hypothetical protein n=1 Tax=Vibrio pectenicida TaxID=62763 RepID=UPI003B9AA492
MKKLILSTLALTLFASNNALAEDRYSPNELLYGGVSISSDGILTSQANFACAAPMEVELRTSIDNSVQVAIKDRLIDCMMIPWVQEFSIDLKPHLQQYGYHQSEVTIVNKISFELPE